MSSSKHPDSDRSTEPFSPLPDPWDGENALSNHTADESLPSDESLDFPTPPPPEPESDQETQDLFKGLLIDLDELLTHHDSRSLGRDPDDLETIDDNAAATLTQRISKFEPITPHSAPSPGFEGNGNSNGNNRHGTNGKSPESTPSPTLNPPELEERGESRDIMDFFVDSLDQPQEPTPELEGFEPELPQPERRPEPSAAASPVPPAAPSAPAPELSIDLRAMLGLEDFNAPLQLDLTQTSTAEPLPDVDLDLDLESLELPEGMMTRSNPASDLVAELADSTPMPAPEPEPSLPEPKVVTPPEREAIANSQYLTAQDFMAQDFTAQDLDPEDLGAQDFSTQDFSTENVNTQDFNTIDFSELPPVEAPEATIALDDLELASPEPVATPEPTETSPSRNQFESDVEAALNEFAAMIQPEISPPAPTRKRAVIRKTPPPPPPRRPKPTSPEEAKATSKNDPALADLFRRPVLERDDPLRELRDFLLDRPKPKATTPSTAPSPEADVMPFEPEDLFKSLGLGPEPTPEPTPELTPESTPESTLEPTPEPTPEVTPEPTPEPAPEPTQEVTPEPIPEQEATTLEDHPPTLSPEPPPVDVVEPITVAESPPPQTTAFSELEAAAPELVPAVDQTASDAERALLAQLLTTLPSPSKPPTELDLNGTEPEILQQLITKVQTLEQQIYEPTEVINPLVPLMVQLLKMKVGTSQDMVRAMATPILEEMITERARDNRPGMAMAIADLVPLAIEQEIQKHPQRIAKAIGPEVAAAMQEQMLVERDAIAKSLGPTIGRAIKNQIELERDSMVDALYPVIGGTVNRYIGEAINTINTKVETAFSVDGLTRKVRARMQGVTEAELILQESMPVTVQAIFLIQKTSGLVIAEIQPNREQNPLESNMVAGMLTAIRSFVNDCIAQSGTISELSEVEYGDARIILEVAGYCYLAVVVKGSANAGLLKNIRRTLGQIIQNYGALIEGFEGDSETVPTAITVLLERLGESAVTTRPEKSPKTLLFLVGVVALLIFMPWLYFQVRGFFDQRLSTRIAAALTTELDDIAYSPLTSAVEGGRVRLEGRVPAERFKDEASTIAQGLAPGKTLDNQIHVVTTPPDPAAVAGMIQLVTGLLNRNPGVDIRASYSPERVILTGSYRTTEDYEEIIQAFKTLPGIENLIEQDLLPQALARRIYFERDSAELNATEQMDKIIPISQFLRDNPDIEVRITGYVDASGPMEQNQDLSLRRADVVKEAIAAQGIDVNRMEVVGTVERPPGVTDNEAAWLSRCVRFELVSPEES